MVKTLIVYETRQGYTKKCVKEIESLIDGSVIIVRGKDGCKEALEQYDLIIIGAAVYAGRIPSSIRKFCKLKINDLLQRPLALFMCGTGEELQETNYKKNYPSALLDHALQKGWFGGVIEVDKHKNITKFVLSRILKGEKELHVEKLESIKPFVEAIKKSINRK